MWTRVQRPRDGWVTLRVSMFHGSTVLWAAALFCALMGEKLRLRDPAEEGRQLFRALDDALAGEQHQPQAERHG